MIVARYTLHDAPVPVSYEVLLIDGRGEVVIDRMLQEDGSYKWAIRDGCRTCFSKKGEWDYESMPSNRPDDWIDTHRFDTFEEASKLAHAAAKVKIDGYLERVEIGNKQIAEREKANGA